MDAMGSFLDEADFGAGLEECLSRDVNMLREALANDGGASDEFSDFLGEEKIVYYTWGAEACRHGRLYNVTLSFTAADDVEIGDWGAPHSLSVSAHHL